MQVNYYYQATVVKIIDGDTVKLNVDLGFFISIEVVIRLARINAPELKGNEYFDGLESMQFLGNIIPAGTKVNLECKGKDKYGGRWIGEIFKDGININDTMVENGMAKHYY